MILPSDKRIASRAAIRTKRGLGDYAPSAAGIGPVGSATMTWVTIFQMLRTTDDFQYMFHFVDGSTTSGWVHYVNATAMTFSTFVANGAATAVGQHVRNYTVADLNQPVIMISTLAGGQLTSVAMNSAPAPVAVVGYTTASLAQRVRIGAWGGSLSPCKDMEIYECAMFQGYDGTGFVSTAFGNGLPGLQAMWAEDLQQGRYLTPPRVTAVNSDWYWSARDVGTGGGATKTLWTDRFTGTVLTKIGNPQASNSRMVF
jgi:hypothetical protein